MDRKFVRRSCRDEHDLLSELEHAVNNKSLHHLLQVYAEGVDLTLELPTSVRIAGMSADVASDEIDNDKFFHFRKWVRPHCT